MTDRTTARRSHWSHRGFTPIELMVVLVMIGVLLVTLAPSMIEWLRNLQVRSAAESISTGLQKARAEAVRRNQNVYFSLVTNPTNPTNEPGQLTSACALSSSNASWVVSLASPAGKCEQAAGGSAAPQILDKQAKGNGFPDVTVQVKTERCAATASSTQVMFNSLGSPANASPIRCIEITHPTSPSVKLQVRIDAGGGVRSCIHGLRSDDARACPAS